MVTNPLPLDRHHVLMNKFKSPECPDYTMVAEKVKEFISKIRTGTLLAHADAWICQHAYNDKRLKIKRVSGTELLMDQCYINVSIIERTNKAAHVSQSFPISLAARLRVEKPSEATEVKLSLLFNERKGPDGRKMRPRRILIRGRAGVGKTTLCKKIVYSFINKEWPEWTELFDHILWVPLRNLKQKARRLVPGYNFTKLFSHEYFSTANRRKDLARTLSDTSNSGRTLFLLDGLDEVLQDLEEGDISSFLKDTLL